MKKLFQFVAGIALALLAIQPACSGQLCTTGAPHTSQCVPTCPMSQMGPDCPMEHRSDGAGCPSNCCQRVIPPAAVIAASVEKRPLADHQLQALPLATFTIPAVAADQSPSDPPAIGPPRYILLQVFRI